MDQVSQLPQSTRSAALGMQQAQLRGLELSSQLRSAVSGGDDARIARVLSDLLRVKGLTKSQRVTLQMRALLGLVQSLRSAALNDEVTGLYNRRGFMQTATRLMDLASQSGKTAHLIYFSVATHSRFKDDAAQPEVVARQMGNFMRDLFPGYGVYDVLGRLANDEFAALTTSGEYASCSAILMRARRSQKGCDVPMLPLHVGIAHYDPEHPLTIEELLQSAALGVNAPAVNAPALNGTRLNGQPKPNGPVSLTRIASPRFAPQPGVTLC